MADTHPNSPDARHPGAEVHRADPVERRRNLQILVIVVIFGALLLMALNQELDGIRQRVIIGDVDLAADRFLWMVRGCFVLLALAGLVAGLVIGSSSLAVIREQRFPHAAARTLRDQVVVRGRRAVMLGRLGVVLALAFVLVGFAGAAIGWRLLAHFQ